MTADPRLRLAAAGFAAYYVALTTLELVLALTHKHTLSSFDGTLLFESTVPHAGIHVAMSLALVVCAAKWRRLGRPALWALGAILAVTSLVSLLHREFAGQGLGHDTMPAGYLIVNGAAAAGALMAAWLLRPTA